MSKHQRGFLFSFLCQASSPDLKWLFQISAQGKKEKKNVEVRLVYTSIKEISFCDRFRVFPQKFLLNHTKTCGRTTARPLAHFIMLEGNKKSFKNNKSTLLEFPEWIGGDLKAHPVPGQGHLPLSQAVQSSIQRKDAPALLIFWQYFGSI